MKNKVKSPAKKKEVIKKPDIISFDIKMNINYVDIRHKVEDVVGSLIDNLYNFIDIIKTKDEE